MMRAFLLALGFVVGIAAVAPVVQAQFVSTQLPTPYAGDYLNGAAASDVAGGLFLRGDRAQPIPAVGFGIPTAFGADWRDVFAAVSGHVGHNRGGWFRDGAVFLGTGLGDHRRLTGVEAETERACWAEWRSACCRRSAGLPAGPARISTPAFRSYPFPIGRLSSRLYCST